MIPYNTQFDYKTQRQQWIDDNKHLCVTPFKEIQFHAKVKWPCCHYTQKPELGSPTDRVKQAIQTKAIDQGCNTCHLKESMGQISPRQRDLLNLSEEELDNFLHNNKFNDLSIFLTFGNKCNMACRTCNPDTSSLYKKLVSPNSIILTEDNSKFIEEIISIVKSQISNYEVIRLVILGGEGTLNDELYVLFDRLKFYGLNQNVAIQIGSNGSVFREDKFAEWCESFKHVGFFLSIDGVHENFHYVRWPIDFDKIDYNLSRFVELKNQYSNFDFNISPLFYINNIAYLEDWLDYFETLHKSTPIGVFDNTLIGNPHYNIRNLPTYLKQILAKQVAKTLEKKYLILDHNTVFRQSLQTILGLLNTNIEVDADSTAQQKQIWDTYLKKTAQWDTLTGASGLIYNSKLWEHISSSDLAQYQMYLSQFKK